MADLRADTERFSFEVDGLDEELRVVRFRGSEALSQLFRFELTVAAESPDLNFEDVVNQAALLTVEGDSPRYVNGIVSRIEVSGQAGRFTLYDLTVVPAVWRLKLRHDCRIFQEKSVQEIVQDVLETAGVPGDTFEFDLQDDPASRTYCVQYRESDWDFISRLLEEEGIFYFFAHTESLCKLVMADHAAAESDIEGDPTLPFVPASGLKTTEEHITRFTYAEEVRPGKVALTDYNFTKPSLDLAEEAAGDVYKELEVYDYPGDYLDPDVGKHLAAVRLAALNAVRKSGGGESDSARLVPGFQFELSDHPREALNAKYALTEVYQTGEQPQVLEERAGGAGQVYTNRFECVPADTDFRPPRLTPKPVVEGVQTAIVVGPSGEEIYTDEFGRVKVHFHWDRLGAPDDTSSCWIRVSQTWAGAAWGAIHIPRIGQEVIVDFVEGDPDRPIITGRVYHGTNRPPYALPDNKTQSGVKSNTSTGGGGSNELRFEDKAGSEEVFLHAQKDLTVAVENDRTHTVGGNDKLHVTKKQEVTVDGDEGASFTATGNVSVSTAAEFSLTAASKITLTVGGSSITIDGGSISLHSAAVHITGTTTIDGETTVNGKTSITGATSVNGNTTIDGGSVSISGSGGVTVTGATVGLNS
jgi:type VI secretion system secreted protein VgrG